MIEQLGKINKIYDLLALCCSYILTEFKNNPYEFMKFKDDDYEDVYGAIERYCCEVQEKGRKAAFNELRDFLYEYLQSGINIERCYAIVKSIDELVDIEISDKLIGGKGIVKYSSINGQYVDQVKILPKVRETFLTRGENQFKKIENNAYSLFRKRRECACSTLDEVTVNYMIWDEERIRKYPMWIYHVDEKNSISKHFYDREKIVFGIVPLTNKGLDEILEIKYQEKAFYIERMYNEAEQELKLRYEDIYDRCKMEDIDFLIFPEMLMTDDIIKSLQNKEKGNSPQIIINGSIWKEYMNKSIVTDGTGKVIFSYLKKEPFKFKKGEEEYREYLNRAQNKEYAILEIDRVGRIGIGICKDLLNEDVKLFHKYIGTDILIIPAYTKSMDLQSSAEELSAEYNCVVVVANACSALGEKNESGRRIGFISLPAKYRSDRTRITRNYCKDKCVDECECRCIGKLFAIDFYHTEGTDDVISYKIQESPF